MSLPGTSPKLAWLPCPAVRGNTHQLHLGPQSFQDAVGSLCLLLQGKRKRGRRKVISDGLQLQPSAQLSPCAKIPSENSAEPPQIPSLPGSGWKGSAQPLDLQESPAGEELWHLSHHDFNASKLCLGCDPNPRPLGARPVGSCLLPLLHEKEGG